MEGAPGSLTGPTWHLPPATDRLAAGGGQEPALHQAIRKRNHEIIQLLLQYSAPVNTPHDRGVTALHLAIQEHDQKIVQLLLDNKADVNAKDEAGRTPLDLAIELDNVAAVQLLLMYGAKVQ
ncbi:ankyrin [Lophiostoma macrostomum CBS 122681]|uniref:Ankyrin n=1 Tax=Lophiostoma macrostomum CBS 122681 TaxID=1314788 RepID=A0A6A6SST2_9PLEO|nr:ankyrin [Lophiostoma macrostomum CBS 122681]